MTEEMINMMADEYARAQNFESYEDYVAAYEQYRAQFIKENEDASC